MPSFYKEPAPAKVEFKKVGFHIFSFKYEKQEWILRFKLQIPVTRPISPKLGRRKTPAEGSTSTSTTASTSNGVSCRRNMNSGPRVNGKKSVGKSKSKTSNLEKDSTNSISEAKVVDSYENDVRAKVSMEVAGDQSGKQAVFVWHLTARLNFAGTCRGWIWIDTWTYGNEILVLKITLKEVMMNRSSYRKGWFEMTFLVLLFHRPSNKG